MKRFEIKSGNIVMSCSGTMGKVAIVPEGIKKGIINQALLLLIPNRNIQNTFIKYWMENGNFQDSLKAYSSGAAIQNVASVKTPKEIKIPLPPLSEQQRIVAILDETLEALAKAKERAEKNLQNACELFESYLESVFANPGEGWEEKNIAGVATITSGYSFASNDFSPKNYVKSVKITNVGVKEFVEESDNLLPKSFESQYEKYLVREGEIVIALTRSIIAKGLKVSVVPKSYNMSLLNQRVAAICGNSKFILNSFLYSFLCSKMVKSHIQKQFNTLMQPNLSIKDLANLIILVPSLPEQQAIVSKLDGLSVETKKLEGIYQKKLSNLEELKKSILQKAFEGELTN